MALVYFDTAHYVAGDAVERAVMAILRPVRDGKSAPWIAWLRAIYIEDGLDRDSWTGRRFGTLEVWSASRERRLLADTVVLAGDGSGADLPTYPWVPALDELRAKALLQLSLGHHLVEDDATSVRLAKEVVRDLPSASSAGSAALHAASRLREMGCREESLEMLTSLIASDAADAQPIESRCIMNADGSRNYRHHAVLEMARVYADGGAYGEAYESALRAEEEFPRDNWCGTCSGSLASSRQRRLVVYAFLSWNPMAVAHIASSVSMFDSTSWLVGIVIVGVAFIGLIAYCHVRLCRKEEAEKARLSGGNPIDSVSA